MRIEGRDRAAALTGGEASKTFPPPAVPALPRKRTYRLGKRAITVQETRTAILDAAYGLLGDASAQDMSIDAVARRAGVARTTVYHQFGSRAGLFRALVVYVGEQNALRDVQRVREQSDARAAVLDYVPACVAFWHADATVFRKLFGLALLDDDVRDAIDTRDRRRRETLLGLVRRLREARQLRPGVDEGGAADMISLVTSFPAYDQLCRRSGMTPEAAAAALLSMIGHLLAD